MEKQFCSTNYRYEIRLRRDNSIFLPDDTSKITVKRVKIFGVVIIVNFVDNV